MNYRIMIVEDDAMIFKSLSNHVTKWGYDVNGIRSFDNVLDEVMEYKPDLILIDISLPFYNGFHWCKKIRELSKIPIIFISSAADNMNMIMAMNMGADDFVSKPFDINVLIAKIGAIIRRTYEFDNPSDVLCYKEVYLSISNAIVSFKDKKQELSKNEFKILQVLIENKEKIVSRDTLMTRLWETDCYVDENTLSVNVNRLRKKLEEIGIEGFIKTKKGLGYLIEE